ncbi:acyl carrier protein phosphodiesterase [Chitinophaga lutea]
MNYLAHAYLSFHDPAVMTGQMIADFVKGSQINALPAPIQHGVRMHRALDEFTDKHPATRSARAIFRPSCGAYGGVFMDIVYDHFLANDDALFTPATLQTFATEVYATVGDHDRILPPVFRQIFQYMRTQDWLYHYRERDGIFKSFSGIVRRARYFDRPATVPFSVFEEHYLTLGDCYRAFFPDATAFMRQLAKEA